jgi:S1-C subfamily serine protease
MGTVRLAALLLAALAACAEPMPAPPPAPSQHSVQDQDSVVPAGVGIVVRQDGGTIIVSAVRPGSRAEALGVRAGDVVERMNGEALTSAREFYRRVLDMPPGSIVRLELRRAGRLDSVELPARQLDTMPRV